MIEKFKLRARDVVTNESISGFWEKYSMDSRIAIDDVSGIADTSKNFAEFLTVCRKYRYQCIYVFRIITPEIQIWKKIISQTNFFNIFFNIFFIIFLVNVDRQQKNIFQPSQCGLTGSELTLLLHTNVIT